MTCRRMPERKVVVKSCEPHFAREAPDGTAGGVGVAASSRATEFAKNNQTLLLKSRAGGAGARTQIALQQSDK